MARIYPFRAVRYNTMDVAMGNVVTQPYDKITPSMQQAYYAHSPYNLVRLILGLPELFDVPGENDVYTRAKRDFDEWRHTGVLYRENEPCIFAYAQTFPVPGTNETQVRRGFIALGEVLDYAAGVVFRHEQTLDQPKHDRMQLLQATRAPFWPDFHALLRPRADRRAHPLWTQLPRRDRSDRRVWRTAPAGPRR